MTSAHRAVVAILVIALAACATSPSPSPPAAASPTPAEGSPSAGGKPSAGPSPVRTVAPNPSPVAAGTLVQVLVDGLRIRDAPGTGAVVVGTLSAGQRARVVGGPWEMNGFRWYQISLEPSDLTGWLAAGDGESSWIARVTNGEVTVAAGSDIWSVDQAGNRRLFAQLAAGWGSRDPTWAPDGHALAISESRVDASQQGCILDGIVAVLDGAGRLIAHTSPPPGTWDGAAIWSPDGSQIGFLRWEGTCDQPSQEAQAELYVMPAAGGAERLVVEGVLASAFWSPAGDAIAFARFNYAPAVAGDLRGPEIWTVAPDGFAERRLGGRIDDGQRERVSDRLAWAPDASFIAYSRAVGDDLNSTEIDLINLEGQIQAVTRLARLDKGPVWVPDGTGLVYQEDWATGIVVLSPPGYQAERLASDNSLAAFLALSPDGTSLLWQIPTEAAGVVELQLQPLAGGVARTYQFSGGSGWAWRPLLVDVQ